MMSKQEQIEQLVDENLMLRDVLGDHEGMVEMAKSIIKICDGSDDPTIQSISSEIKSFLILSKEMGYD